MGMKNVMVFNDEAHHCYRERPMEESEETTFKGEDRKEAEKNSEAARVWISGLEAVQRRSRPEPASSTCRQHLSFCAAPATPRELCSHGR